MKISAESHHDNHPIVNYGDFGNLQIDHYELIDV